MIYFLQSLEGGPIKIGHTANVDTRRKQLESHYGQPLAVLATMPGGREEERQIHGRFSHLRFGRTEQFRPATDLMRFIGRPLLVGANPDAVETMPTQGALSIRVDSETAEVIRKAASLKGISISEYLRSAFLPIASRDLVAEAKKITRKSGDKPE